MIEVLSVYDFNEFLDEEKDLFIIFVNDVVK